MIKGSTNQQEYIALDGYKALADLLEKNVPRREIVDEMIRSGLRGRGGAGFPTGRKWAEALKHDADHKYVICNADEGDPGAYMDRSVLENDPHSVLEGMTIAGLGIGADQGYIYVRAEYPNAVKRLNIAIAAAHKAGLLGERILGTDFSFDIELRLGAGAFVCGEGTALMESIEGRRGMPRNKVYRTAERGLFEKPTIINNVETFTAVNDISTLSARQLDALLNATRRGRRIAFQYRSGQAAQAITRTMDPWGLVNVRDRLYLVGFDIDRDAPRSFRITRVDDIVPVGEATHPRPNEVLQGIVERLLRTGQELIDAHLAIAEGRAYELAAKGVHRADGTWDLTGVDRNWLVRTAAAYAPHAVVLGPSEVREAVIQQLAVAQEVYRGA